MSGQWEVVGKKKDKGKNFKLQAPKENQKKVSAPRAPAIEEILPVSQVKNLFKNEKTNNKENKKAKEKNSVQENGVKKPQKKIEKRDKPEKPKLPKSVESGLNDIPVDEFKQTYEFYKKQYPDSPIIGLKELVQFLNKRVPLIDTDPIFKNKSDGYPLNIVPSALKAAIEKSLKEAGKSNMQTFFDISLASMATDMSKDLPVVGHKLFLQSIALNDPKLAITNLNKHTVLRGSYQNRPPIGLSILWAIGQAGLRDFQSGLKVYQELMLPIIEMKSYSRYIYEYLINLIDAHSNSNVTKEQYLLILDSVYSNKKNFPSDLSNSLNKTISKLNLMLLNQNKDLKYHTFVEPFLKKLLDNSSAEYQQNLCSVLAHCLGKDQQSYSTWNKLYLKNLAQSAALLKYVDNNWNSLSRILKGNQLSELLVSFSSSNDELLLKKRKDPIVLACNTTIKGEKKHLRDIIGGSKFFLL